MADDGFPACESGWLHPSCDRPSIKKAHLIAPGVPARPGISGKQLDVGAIYKSLYPISDIIRFAAVFSTGINNQLADPLVLPLGFATCRQQALFGICSRPIS